MLESFRFRSQNTHKITWHGTHQMRSVLLRWTQCPYMYMARKPVISVIHMYKTDITVPCYMYFVIHVFGHLLKKTCLTYNTSHIQTWAKLMSHYYPGEGMGTAGRIIIFWLLHYNKLFLFTLSSDHFWHHVYIKCLCQILFEGLVATIIVKPRLNCHANSVIKSSYKRPLPASVSDCNHFLGITNWSFPLVSDHSFVIIWIREVFNLCGCVTSTFAFVHFVSGQPLLFQGVVT